MYFTRERAALLATSTVAFGLSAVLRKIAVDRVPPLRYQAASSVVYALTVPLFLWLSARREAPSKGDGEGMWWMAVATVAGLVGNLAFGYALRAGNDAGVVSSLSAASPVVTIMLSFLVLGERPSAASAVGCALVLAGVFVISMWG